MTLCLKRNFVVTLENGSFQRKCEINSGFSYSCRMLLSKFGLWVTNSVLKQVFQLSHLPEVHLKLLASLMLLGQTFFNLYIFLI